MKSRLPQGFGGGPTSMQGMLKQAQKMQEDMQNLQAELELKEYEIKAGGGVVTLKINGKKEVLSLEVAPEIVDPDDIETMTDIIIAAINEGIKRVEDTHNQEMSKISGCMGLPGIF